MRYCNVIQKKVTRFLFICTKYDKHFGKYDSTEGHAIHMASLENTRPQVMINTRVTTAYSHPS